MRPHGGRWLGFLSCLGSVLGCQEPVPSNPGSVDEPVPTPPVETSTLDETLHAPVHGDRQAGEDWYQKGLALQAGGQRREARDAFQQAVDADPAHFGALVEYGFALVDTQEDLNQGLALRQFRLARLLRPEDPIATCGEAIARQGVGDFAAARPLLARVLSDERLSDQSQRRALAHFSMAELLFAEGDAAAAEPHYTTALEICAPDRRPFFLVGYATFLVSQNQLDQADTLLQEAIEQNPLHVTAHYQRFRLLTRQQQTEAAEKERKIHEILRQLSDYSSQYYAADADRVIGLRRDMIAAFPEYPRARRDLIRECLNHQRYREALQEISIESKAGVNAELLYLSARANAGLGRLDVARDVTQRFYQLAPNAPDSLILDILSEWQTSHRVSDRQVQQTYQQWKRR